MRPVRDICTTAASAIFPILETAAQIHGGGQGNLPALPIAKFMVVDLGWHPVQPLAARRPRTVTSSIERSPLSSTDLSPICLPVFVL
jgi:hypothetical protein